MPQVTDFTPAIDGQARTAGPMSASGVWQVSGADKIFDLGAGTMKANLHLMISDIEIGSGDELYRLHFQVSDSPAFAGDIYSIFMAEFGASGVLTGGQNRDTAAGHYVFPITNLWNARAFQYARGYGDISGTVVTGLDFQAWLDWQF